MKALAAAVLLLAGCQAPLRSPAGVIVHYASSHIGGEAPVEQTDALGDTTGTPSEDLSEFNPGLGLDWELGSEFRLEFGAFQNSFEDLAPYVAGHWVGYRSDRLEGGLTAGLALYQEPSAYPVVPMVGPWGAVRLGPVWARIVVAPGLDSNVLLAFSLRFKRR